MSQFLFRLTAWSHRAGIFRFEEESLTIELEEGVNVEVVPRDAGSLKDAKRIHFQRGAFETEEKAREEGERLRVRLRVLNAVLGLGLNVPSDDVVTSSSNEKHKTEVEREHGVRLVDSVSGLQVLPDDGRHMELVMSARAENHPSDPAYLGAALAELWSMDVVLDDQTEDALNMINLATLERSERTAFLITYLALESLVSRRSRSQEAQDLIDVFVKSIQKSTLRDGEATSLISGIGGLKVESFRSALMRIADHNDENITIEGLSLRDFFNECVNVRNDVAHRTQVKSDLSLGKLTRGLRRVVLMLIWSRNHIPSLSIDVPASQVTIPAGGMSMRLL